jgi:hypothetical protein
VLFHKRQHAGIQCGTWGNDDHTGLILSGNSPVSHCLIKEVALFRLVIGNGSNIANTKLLEEGMPPPLGKAQTTFHPEDFWLKELIVNFLKKICS